MNKHVFVYLVLEYEKKFYKKLYKLKVININVYTD